MAANCDTSFNSSSEDDEYDWERFIREEGGYPAPAEAFYQPDYVPTNHFVKGHILMAKDKNLPMDSYFVAQIDRTFKCFVSVTIVEIETSFWTICDSDVLSPFEETSLCRHPNNSKTDKAWEKWLTKFMELHYTLIAPPTAFCSLSPRCRPKENLFKPGMVLAYIDEQFSGKFSPAIVVGMKSQSLVTISLADRDAPTHPSVAYYDRRLFPLDFVQESDIPVRCDIRRKKGAKLTPVKGPMYMQTRKRAFAGMDPRKRTRKSKQGRSKASKSKTNSTKEADESNNFEEIDESITPSYDFTPASTSTPLKDDAIDQVKEEIMDTTDNNDITGYFSRTALTVADEEEVEAKPRSPSPISSDLNHSPRLVIVTDPNSEASISDSNDNYEKESTPPPTVTPLPVAQLLEGCQLLKLQEKWLSTCNTPRIVPLDDELSTFPLLRDLNALNTDTCLSSISTSASPGPFLNLDILGKKLTGLPPLHFKMQFYNVIVALMRSGRPEETVFEKVGYNDLHGDDNFSIYVECNGSIRSKKFPYPKNFNNACNWLKTYLKQLQADENLITLQKC